MGLIIVKIVGFLLGHVPQIFTFNLIPVPWGMNIETNVFFKKTIKL